MSSVKLIIAFVLALSLCSLSGPFSKGSYIPNLHLAKASPQLCQTRGATGACSEFWYPAGPAMNSALAVIFSDSTSEMLNLQSGSFSSIDFSDWPLSQSIANSLVQNPSFRVSDRSPSGFSEIEFNLDNNFWGCQFTFGSNACGIHLRQGLSHLIDKSLYVTNSASAGQLTALDDPEPSYNGLPSANPCSWDLNATQSGPNCIVGAPGGTAYHLSSASGIPGYPWMQRYDSVDFCVAAADIMMGLGAPRTSNSFLWPVNPPTHFSPGSQPSTWIFHSNTDCHFDPNSTGLSTFAQNTVKFFVRTDNPDLKLLGESLASDICYLFTGSYTEPCLPYLNVISGQIQAFPGFYTAGTQTNLGWWMYTSGVAEHGPDLLEPASSERLLFHDPFDTSLFQLNSRYVSGLPGIQCLYGSGSSCSPGPCSPSSVKGVTRPDYMWLCNISYDSMTLQMENSPCVNAPGDPVTGQVLNGPGGNCSGTSQLSAFSAAVQAEDLFGAGAFTIPVYTRSNQYGYLNGWNRVINDMGGGIPSYFTWLNTWNPSPPDTGTLRQGMSETTSSVNPYVADTFWDATIVGNVYDTLLASNPLSDSQLFSWMTFSAAVREDNATVRSQSGYEPPPGTLTTYHFTLRTDVFFQDGTPVTAYDVAFSYLSLVGTGAMLGGGGSTMKGITVLSPRAFDIGVNSTGVFTPAYLTSVPILPGRYWVTEGPSAYNDAVTACTGSTACSIAQFALSGANVVCPGAPHPGCASFAGPNLQVDPNKIVPTFDPIANQVLIGSGPWVCMDATGAVGKGCSSTGVQNPPNGGSYTLTRFGCISPGNCLPPASSTSRIYFRSSGDLAVYVWTQENDSNPIAALSSVSNCYGQPVNPNGPCAHWQKGIGASASGVVGTNQVAIVQLRYNLNWISPFEAATNLPLGMGAINPVLYEGAATLNPCSIDPANGYDC